MGKKKNKKYESSISAERIQEILSNADLSIVNDSWDEEEEDTNSYNTDEYSKFVNAKYGNNKAKDRNRKNRTKNEFVPRGKEIDRAINHSVNTEPVEPEEEETPSSPAEKVELNSVYGEFGGFDPKQSDYTEIGYTDPDDVDDAGEESILDVADIDDEDIKSYFTDQTEKFSKEASVPSRPPKEPMWLGDMPEDMLSEINEINDNQQFKMASEFVTLKYLYLTKLQRLTITDGVSAISFLANKSAFMAEEFELSSEQYIQALCELCCNEVPKEDGSDEVKIVFSEENFSETLHTFQKFITARMHPCAIYTEEEFEKGLMSHLVGFDKRAIRIYYDGTRGETPLYYVYYTSGDAQRCLDNFIRTCSTLPMSALGKEVIMEKIKWVFDDAAQDAQRASLILNRIRRLNAWIYLAYHMRDASLFETDDCIYVEQFRTTTYDEMVECGDAKPDGENHSGELAYNMRDIFEAMLRLHKRTAFTDEPITDEDELTDTLGIIDYSIVVEKVDDMLNFIEEASDRDDDEPSPSAEPSGNDGLDLSGPEDGLDYDELGEFLKNMVEDYSDDERPLADMVRASNQVENLAGELYRAYCDTMKEENKTPMSFDEWLDSDSVSEMLNVTYMNNEIGEAEDDGVDGEPVSETPDEEAPVEKVDAEVVEEEETYTPAKEEFGNAQMMDALSGVDFDGIKFPPIRKRSHVK